MIETTYENKTIAKKALEAFGGRPQVSSYWDETERSSVDILTCENRPQEGVNSYATIGLSDAPLLKNGDDTGIRVEFVGACSGAVKEFPNILSTAAFCVINSKWPCAPGTIYPEIVAMYTCSTTMRHLLFVPPFLWEEKLVTLEFDSKVVAWLLAMPISESEYQYAEANGSERLEDLFECMQIDIFDINRNAVV